MITVGRAVTFRLGTIRATGVNVAAVTCSVSFVLSRAGASMFEIAVEAPASEMALSPQAEKTLTTIMETISRRSTPGIALLID